MKKFLLKTSLAIAALLASITASAHDFEVDSIYYSINIADETNTTVAVTYKGNTSINNSNTYSGAVTIPSSVTYNGTTYSVTEIGYEAFYKCAGLTSVTIPNSVTSIGYCAFESCSGLTEVTIPNSVTSIGGYAFWGCTGLTEVNITDLSAWCKIDFEIEDPHFSENPLYWAHHLKLNGTEITNLVIPDDVTEIKYSAFVCCDGLTSVTIPNSVTEIDDNAFWFCDGLTSVTIGNSVTSIGDYAFQGCSSLTSVSIPNSVTSIGSRAFESCSGLTSVTIGNSVTSIGYCAFYKCAGLTSVTIPNSVTSIGYCAFESCSGLTEVTIPNSVTSIGSYAFYKCSGLTAIRSLNPEPPECGSKCFYGVDVENCTLEVPAGAKDAYASADYWSDFMNIVEIVKDAIVEVFPQGDNVTFEISTIQGAVTYTVNVYSDEAMTQLVATTNYDAAGNIIPMSTSLELSIDGFENGTYYYDVIAKSESGETLNNYTGSFEIVTSGTSNVGSDDTATEEARYDIHGRLLSAPAKGINIVKYSDGTVKKIVIN